MLGKPFHGGFGLINNAGIPKPNFWVFKMLSTLCPQRFVLPRAEGEVEYAAFTDGNNVQVLLYAQDMDYFKHGRHDVTISVNMTAKKVGVQRIDDVHCNPKAAWEKLGSPDILTREEAAAIKESTRLREEDLDFTTNKGMTDIHLSLSTNDVVLLRIENAEACG